MKEGGGVGRAGPAKLIQDVLDRVHDPNAAITAIGGERWSLFDPVADTLLPIFWSRLADHVPGSVEDRREKPKPQNKMGKRENEREEKTKKEGNRPKSPVTPFHVPARGFFYLFLIVLDGVRF